MTGKSANSFLGVALASEALAGVDESGVVASAQSDYALLQAGKMSLDEFMDLTVERALSHLQGQLPAEKLELMREVLRNGLQSDPALSALASQIADGK